MSYQFKWSVLWSGQSATWLLQGLLTTLELSALAWVLAVALGILSGALRTVRIAPDRMPSVTASSHASTESSSVVMSPWSSQFPDWPLQSTLHLNW